MGRGAGGQFAQHTVPHVPVANRATAGRLLLIHTATPPCPARRSCTPCWEQRASPERQPAPQLKETPRRLAHQVLKAVRAKER